MININQIRNQFPILNQKVYDKQVIYFDNAATTQKPQSVIDTLTDAYTKYNSNVHRGVHYMSDFASNEYELARKKLQNFIGAEHYHEVILTYGTTAAINMLAFSFGEKYINPGDEIIISHLEHHSNIVPWQMVCERKGAILKVIPMNDQGELLMEEYDKLLSDKTKLVSVGYVSNSLGTINPVKQIIEKAHNAGAKVMIDAAQGVQHIPIDVKELDCDFMTFSGHKMYAPTGVGVLYGKEKFLEEMPPYMGGGAMISDVTFEKTTYNNLPLKFEAGTPNYVDVIGFGTAVDFINQVGIENIKKHEDNLLEYAHNKLQDIDNLKFYGEAKAKTSVVSFNIGDVHPYDIGSMIDKIGVAVRTGNHCTQPIMDYFGIPGVIRASVAVYNTKEEIDIFADAVKKVSMMLV